MTTEQEKLKRVSVSFKWEPRDLWVGVFIKRERDFWLAPAIHLYICPLPTLLVHVVLIGKRHDISGSR